MATPTRKPAPWQPDNPTPAVAPFAEWPLLLLQPVLDAQRLQWQALLSWQQTFASLNEDLWEQWAARWGGGVPIDG